MMENAGLQLANVARDLFLGGEVVGKRVAILAGTGGNEGGAIVAARKLVNWGATCDIGLSRTSDDLAEVPQNQFNILKKISQISLIEPPALSSDYDLIIEGLIGYSLNGSPRGNVAEFIVAANATDTPVLSLDVPSGYDGGTGEVRMLRVHADATVTLALPKLGMLNKDRSKHIGRL